MEDLLCGGKRHELDDARKGVDELLPLKLLRGTKIKAKASEDACVGLEQLAYRRQH